MLGGWSWGTIWKADMLPGSLCQTVCVLLSTLCSVDISFATTVLLWCIVAVIGSGVGELEYIDDNRMLYLYYRLFRFEMFQSI